MNEVSKTIKNLEEKLEQAEKNLNFLEKNAIGNDLPIVFKMASSIDSLKYEIELSLYMLAMYKNKKSIQKDLILEEIGNGFLEEFRATREYIIEISRKKFSDDVDLDIYKKDCNEYEHKVEHFNEEVDFNFIELKSSFFAKIKELSNRANNILSKVSKENIE